MGLLSWLKNLICFDIQARLEAYRTLSEMYKKEVTELRQEIAILNGNVNPPSWLDTAASVYTPKVVIYFNNQPQMVALDPRDFYIVTPEIQNIADRWRDLDHDEKLHKIWEFVIKKIRYAVDYGEDWRFPDVTLKLGKGDCEDGSILFVSLARAAGIDPRKVFNATGWYRSGSQRFGHSFPIAQLSDGKWYVFETTLDWVPSEPMLFRGSNYDASWGLHNWLWKGKIKGGNQI